MLGEGTVSFGVAVVTVCARNRKWSPKITSSPSCTFPVMAVTFGVQVICPSLR